MGQAHVVLGAFSFAFTIELVTSSLNVLPGAAT
jgi:hypothetical protein